MQCCLPEDRVSNCKAAHTMKCHTSQAASLQGAGLYGYRIVWLSVKLNRPPQHHGTRSTWQHLGSNKMNNIWLLFPKNPERKPRLESAEWSCIIRQMLSQYLHRWSASVPGGDLRESHNVKHLTFNSKCASQVVIGGKHTMYNNPWGQGNRFLLLRIFLWEYLQS